MVYFLSGEKGSEPVNTCIITNHDKSFKENERSALIGKLQTVVVVALLEKAFQKKLRPEGKEGSNQEKSS